MRSSTFQTRPIRTFDPRWVYAGVHSGVKNATTVKNAIGPPVSVLRKSMNGGHAHCRPARQPPDLPPARDPRRVRWFCFLFLKTKMSKTSMIWLTTRLLVQVRNARCCVIAIFFAKPIVDELPDCKVVDRLMMSKSKSLIRQSLRRFITLKYMGYFRRTSNCNRTTSYVESNHQMLYFL